MYQLSQLPDLTRSTRNFSNSVLQPKLKIGQPGDKYEQEADSMADQVMRMSQSDTMQMQPAEEEEELLQCKIQMQPEEEEEELLQPKLQMQPNPNSVNSILQMQEAEEEEEIIQAKTAIQKEVSKPAVQNGAHTSLPESLQAKMEDSFGTDFGNVNIHKNDRSAAQIGALAYTKGNNVHFAPEQYNPGSQKGQELIGHELTHVVQQREGKVTATLHGKGMLINDNPGLEKEADIKGKRAVKGEIVHSGGVEQGNSKNVVQGFFKGVTKSGVNYRVADDLSATVRVGYPNHILYAKSGKAATANTKLSAVGSGIELTEESATKTVKNSAGISETLKQVLPKNKINSSSGDKMKLWADCGKSAGVVVGGTNRGAVHTDISTGKASTTKESSPALMKAEIMQKLLKYWETHANTSASLKKKIKDTFTKAEAKKKEMEAALDKLSKATTNVEKELYIDTYWEKATEYGELMMQIYNELDPSKKEEIDKYLKINEFANPDVGHGYTMSTGGEGYSGKKTWNFHWGGVVMKSDSAKDNITLENYAVGDASVQNEKWDFAMYGTEKKEQTFHSEHQKTKQHGKTPTTMHIKNR